MRDEEKARLVGEFRRLAAEAERKRSLFPALGDSCVDWRLEAVQAAWNQAAQMLEESKP